MRQITEQAVNAFTGELLRPFKMGNTEVKNLENGERVMILHGHEIARFCWDRTLRLDSHGYKTNVTKERLNGLLRAYSLPLIFQKAGVWYIGDTRTAFIDGKRVRVIQ